MNVFIPSPLLSYTHQSAHVSAEGSTLVSLLEDLNRQFPGIRFRMIDEQDCIRPHIKIFVNKEQVKVLNTQLLPSDEIVIICALSGG